MMKVGNYALRSVVISILIFLVFSLNAQENESPFTVGGDMVSSYVWRGSKIGTGPNIQPCMELSFGSFTVGSWGSFSLHPESGDFMEADLYASFNFDFGLSMGITDYYYQGTPYFRYNTDSASHAFELNLAYEFKVLSLAANYIINDASMGGPANKPGGGDLYFELACNFESFSLFAGAGNGWHTNYEDNGDDIFTVCNIGISTEKELKLSETFSLPVSGAIILNPDKEEFNLVVGISF